MKKGAEILAPVGKPEALIPAVRSGADAVYLGQHSFSARKNAGNFSAAELKEACKYARIRGVKVYLALNTLVKDKELPLAIDAINTAVDCGVDAIIVQDLGLLRLLREYVPLMPIHASTQMSITSAEGVSLLAEMGAKRVVLGRELSFCEIADIKSKTDCELEVFVHGALCMSVSGQCLFSSVLGSRSGNRGFCAQPCRLPFASSFDKNGYSLSLKDLSVIDYTDKLSEIGVSSLKIEGRMKRPEYVSCASKSIYDYLCDKAYDESLLKDVFSRNGFTKGYFEGKLDKNMFGKREKEDVISAPEAFSKIHEFYKKELQRIGVRFSLKVKIGEPLYIEISDNDGNSVSLFDDEITEAKSAPVNEAFFKDRLSKLGGTPYFLEGIFAEIENGAFVSSSHINALKASLCDALSEKRGEYKRLSFGGVSQFEKAYKSQSPKIYVRVNRLSDLSAENLSDADLVFVSYKNVLLSLVKDELREKIVLSLPVLTFSPQKTSELKNDLKKLYSLGYRKAAADTLGILSILREIGFEIIGLSGLNAMNSLSFSQLKSLGVKECVASVETSAKDISALSSPIPFGVLGFSHLPLMTCRTCPITHNRDCKNCKAKGGLLTDRMGYRFPVRCSEEYSEVLNSQPLYIGDKRDSFKNVSFFLLDLRSENSADEVFRAFRNGAPLNRELTRGLYFKELL